MPCKFLKFLGLSLGKASVSMEYGYIIDKNNKSLLFCHSHTKEIIRSIDVNTSSNHGPDYFEDSKKLTSKCEERGKPSSTILSFSKSKLEISIRKFSKSTYTIYFVGSTSNISLIED